MAKCQRKILLRVASACRTVSTDALQVITSLSPIKLVAKERKAVHNGRTNTNNPKVVRETERRKLLS